MGHPVIWAIVIGGVAFYIWWKHPEKIDELRERWYDETNPEKNTRRAKDIVGCVDEGPPLYEHDIDSIYAVFRHFCSSNGHYIGPSYDEIMIKPNISYQFAKTLKKFSESYVLRAHLTKAVIPMFADGFDESDLSHLRGELRGMVGRDKIYDVMDSLDD